MNRLYRTVWNEVTRTFVAVAECVRSKGKSASSRSAEGSEATLLAGSLMVGGERAASPLPSRRKLALHGIRPLALEQRFMFDGAAVTAVADVSHVLESGDASPHADAVNLQPLALATPPAGSVRTEIVFIESNVVDYQTLLAGLKPGAEVHVLDSTRDGLAQMVQILNGRSGIDAIHIFSHGSEASLHLGTLNLTAQNLDDHSSELAAIGRTLDVNADILLYGCDVAEGSDGAAFIAALAQTTEADIAASTDTTGARIYGGDWVLEGQTGSIETVLPVTTEAIEGYQYTLAVFDFESGVGSGTGTVSQTVSGVTVSATTSDTSLGTWNPGSDTVLYSSTNGNAYLQFTFNQAVDVSSFLVGFSANTGPVSSFSIQGFNGATTYTYDVNPTYSNLNNGSGLPIYSVNLSGTNDWGMVTSIKVTALGGGSVTFVADDIVFTPPPQPPAITSATYDASTNSLVLTGTGLLATTGATNDINVSKLTLTGQGGATYALTSSNVEITSATSFTVALNATDQVNVEGLLNKNGTSSVGGTTFNIAAAADWNPATAGSADLTGNGVTVSNVQTPTITSSTYDASTGSLVVTGTNLVAASGAANDITANKFTLTGEGGATHTLTNTANVEISSGTGFTLTLSATDKAAINQMLNKNGTSTTGGTTYNLAVADDWNTVIGNTSIADTTGNGITTSNVAVPAITSSTYNASTGLLAVTGTGFLKLSGATNDIVANKLTFTGEGGSTYTLTDTANVEITSGTAFSLTLSATDRAAINQIINKNGTSSTSGTTYNLAAAEDWAAGAAAGVTDVDISGNGITTSNVAVPAITSSTYDAATGVVVVTGSGFLSKSGANNDIDLSKLQFKGEGSTGFQYTLTTASVDVTSSTSFTFTLNAADKAGVNMIDRKSVV